MKRTRPWPSREVSRAYRAIFDYCEAVRRLADNPDDYVHSSLFVSQFLRANETEVYAWAFRRNATARAMRHLRRLARGG